MLCFGSSSWRDWIDDFFSPYVTFQDLSRGCVTSALTGNGSMTCMTAWRQKRNSLTVPQRSTDPVWGSLGGSTQSGGSLGGSEPAFCPHGAKSDDCWRLFKPAIMFTGWSCLSVVIWRKFKPGIMFAVLPQWWLEWCLNQPGGLMRMAAWYHLCCWHCRSVYVWVCTSVSSWWKLLCEFVGVDDWSQTCMSLYEWCVSVCVEQFINETSVSFSTY